MLEFDCWKLEAKTQLGRALNMAMCTLKEWFRRLDLRRDARRNIQAVASFHSVRFHDWEEAAEGRVIRFVAKPSLATV